MANKYWYSAGSSDWMTLSNWWDDIGHITPSLGLPTGSDNVIIVYSTSPIVDISIWTQPSSINCVAKRIKFTNSTAPSKIAISCAITGDCEFQSGINIDSTIVGNCDIYGDSILTVTSSGITGTVKFYDSSISNGPVIGKAFYYSSAVNNSTVTGEATFAGDSNNAGTITGNAIFAENSVNSGSVSGWSASDSTIKDNDFGKYVWQPNRAGMRVFIKTGV